MANAVTEMSSHGIDRRIALQFEINLALYLMTKISRVIKRRLLEIPLKRAAPDRIPRSGEAGEAVNCFTTRVMRRELEPLIVASAVGDTLECLAFDGEQYSINTKIQLGEIIDEPFEFTHYYGLVTITYNGWFDLARGQVFRLPYIHAWLSRQRGRLSQGVYNRRKLVTKDRIGLLKAVLDAQLNGRDKLSSLDVMTAIHSIRWYLHPNSKVEHEKVKLYLRALADTGELRGNFNYQITGKGIAAIELYEEQERLHAKSMSGQRKMVWLTVVIVLLTIVQAGLVKLPPLLDFSGK